MTSNKDTYTSLSFNETGYFSSLMGDYLDKKASLNPFYGNFPDLEGFKKQIEAKQSTESCSAQTRKILVAVLKDQYKTVSKSDVTSKNIELLLSQNTFTVTTGHQLNLFTGPLYFLYKIVTAINLAQELKQAFADKNFVPIYWMATEDHDFEEINYFNFKGKKVKWDRPFGGAVGRLSTEGLDKVLEVFASELGDSSFANDLKKVFKEAYLQHDNLADATFYLANQLFSDYGLVILNADNHKLKKLFGETVKDELLNQTCVNAVDKTSAQLATLDYKIQVNARPINLFYLTDDLRERIVFDNNNYKVLNTNLKFTKSEISAEIDNYPERFSPNVLMRPLYQEQILPNLAYIGGGGELAYWFQMKAYFEKSKVPFPILFLRNSLLVINHKQHHKLNKLGLKPSDLFLNQSDLIAKAVKEVSDIAIDFSSQKEVIQQMFSDLKTLALKTDKSFIGAVNAQEHKQLKGLDTLEKRLLRAQKRKYNELVTRINELQNQLFPNQSLQERYQNMSELYLELGDDFIPMLIKHLKPLDLKFGILSV